MLILSDDFADKDLISHADGAALTSPGITTIIMTITGQIYHWEHGPWKQSVLPRQRVT